MANLETVQFALNYVDAKPLHLFIAIADATIVCLEEEQDRFESILES
jgi:hypothetical protein